MGLPTKKYPTAFRAGEQGAGGGTVVLNPEIGIIYFLEFPIQTEPKEVGLNFLIFRDFCVVRVRKASRREAQRKRDRQILLVW
jgi:hypothetical protein